MSTDDLMLKLIILDLSNDKSNDLIDIIYGKRVLRDVYKIGFELLVSSIYINELLIRLNIWVFNDASRIDFSLGTIGHNTKGAIIFQNTLVDQTEQIYDLTKFLIDRNPNMPIMLITGPKSIDDKEPSISLELKETIQNQNGLYYDFQHEEVLPLERYFDEFVIKILNKNDIGITLDERRIFKEHQKEVSLDFLMNLLEESQKLLNTKSYKEAKTIIDLVKKVSTSLDLKAIPQEFSKLEKELEKSLHKTLVINKSRMHKAIYEQHLKRCTLHKEINSECMKIEKILSIIEKPKIFGFFMYEFPKENSLKYDYTSYNKEIKIIKELIEIVNKNSIIQINFPSEATGVDIKTCSFCEISRSYDFGILLLSPLNPNAFLEAGMFMSLGKRVILMNNETLNESVPFDLSPFFYIPYETPKELEETWHRKVIPFLMDLINNYYDI